MNNLPAQQDKLQTEAKQVIHSLGLTELLSKYGTPTLIGSTALGLMVWRDIDIEVTIKDFTKEELVKIISAIFISAGYRIDVCMINNYEKLNANLPLGYYLGLKYFGDISPEEAVGSNEKIWKIDIWFLTEGNLRGKIKTEELQSKLTEGKRRAILEIKDAVAKNPKYRKEIKSMDIYIAVLDKGIKNLEEFEKYLNGLGKSL